MIVEGFSFSFSTLSATTEIVDLVPKSITKSQILATDFSLNLTEEDSGLQSQQDLFCVTRWITQE